MVGVVYKRRVEEGREEKQNTPAGPRKLSLGSAGHCALIGFWVGSSMNVNLVWLYAMGLEKRRMTTNCNTEGLWCALGLCKFTAALTIRPRKGSIPRVVWPAPTLCQCIFGQSVPGQLQQQRTAELAPRALRSDAAQTSAPVRTSGLASNCRRDYAIVANLLSGVALGSSASTWGVALG